MLYYYLTLNKFFLSNKDMTMTKHAISSTGSRFCKHCIRTVAYVYVKLDNRNRSIYVNSENQRWYGTQCPDCFRQYNRDKSRENEDKEALSQKNCKICKTEFSQKNIFQIYCTKTCRVKARKYA